MSDIEPFNLQDDMSEGEEPDAEDNQFNQLDMFEDGDPGLEVDIPILQEDLNHPEEHYDVDDDDEDEDDDDDVTAPPHHGEGSYDPGDFDHLKVDAETQELFVLILKYTPQTVDLEYKFRPFIPDYIPAVGDIDAFIRVPRPDGKPEPTGLNVLDEPSAKQSDPNVLELQLRVVSKQTASSKSSRLKRVGVGDIKEVEKWVRDISDLHRAKPNPSVNYQKPMPDIDTLMQEWPDEIEESLATLAIPTADLDVDLGTKVDLMCSLLDIPVYRNRVQSLHVLFSLYSAFRTNKFLGDFGRRGNPGNGADVLQL